ncbi:hypothetical protein WJX82_003515 [Trebouxia sp. C0006]
MFSLSSAQTTCDAADMTDWPCKLSALESARDFVKDVANKGGKVLLAPDRDADGLCAGATLHHALTALGATDIDTYFVPKGENIHTKKATEALSVFNAAALIVLDQGSRGGPAILPGVPTLILDHHQSTVFPNEAKVASAYGHEPVATTSLLAYVLCHDLHPSLEEKVNWLGVLGTFGDLGSGVKWQPPFPDMGSAIKQYGGKQKFSQAVSLINAPRRTAACDMAGVWQAVLQATSPKDIVDGKVPGVEAMQAARDEVTGEVNKHARAPPKFSADGTVALITINSGAQIHPLIATRWCSSLKGKNLRYVIVANYGYLPDRVNFAARIAKNRANPDVPVDLIASFKAAAETDPGLSEILGDNFARGHAQASGGSVSAEAFKRLLKALGFDENGNTLGGGDKKRKQGGADAGNGTPGKKTKTLMNFGFKKQSPSKPVEQTDAQTKPE